MGVSLIVVHYHTRPALARLLESLRDAPPASLKEILIVNNSGEPLDDLVADLPWPARVLATGRNLGYARGVNEGIRAAREGDFLILNPDVRVKPGAIEALERCAAEHPRAGIVAPKLLNPDGTLQLSARRFYNWRTLLLRRAPLGAYAARSRALREHLMADWDHEDIRPVDWAIGAAMFVRRRAVRDVGLMDERYFLYFEDVDWCQRMWRHGYEVIYCANAKMVHEYARGSAQFRPRSLRAHLAGLLRFTEKWSALLYAVSQNRRRITQLLTLTTDIIAAGCAFLAAYFIRASLDPVFATSIHPLAEYGGFLFFTVAVTVAALAANGLYRRPSFADGIERAFALGQTVFQAGLFLMAATFLFQMPRYSRLLVFLLGPLLYLALLFTRTWTGRLGAGARAHGFAFRRVLVVGSGEEAEKARAALEEARGEGFEPLRSQAPADPAEPPVQVAARLRALVEAERIQIVCIAPQPEEVPYLLAAASALRDSGAAIYWVGAMAALAAGERAARLGPLHALLIRSPSRGLSLRARKRASDLALSLFVAPFRWAGLRAHLSRSGERYGPGEAWGRVWSGRLSWVGRSAYEQDRWVGVPDWARLALESLRPGVVTPPDGAPGDRAASVSDELAYLSRFSLAEDLRIFLRATRGSAHLRRAGAALCVVAILASSMTWGAARASATKLFITNHVNSNEVQGIAVWSGHLTLATLGGIVTYDPGTDRFEKIVRSPGGLPSNEVFCVEVSPSGALWAGTANSGIARLLSNGSFRRTLSSFDGLPGDRVQALYVRGDTVWVGTSAGLALLIENPSNGQISLTRTYTNASTAGALAGDDVRAFLQVADTLWCATTAGLSSFTAGVWQERTAALSRPVTSLAFHADTLWAATDLGPYQYAGGVFRAANSGHAFTSQVLFADASGFYSGSKSSGVRRYAGGAWLAHGTGIPSQQVTGLRDGPDGALWAGTTDGIARYVPSGDSWDGRRSDGPRVNAVRRAIVDSRGAWFATGNAFPSGSSRGVVLHYDGRWSAITSGTTGGSFQSSDAFGLLSDRAGRLWIGHCCYDGDPRPRLDLWDPAANVWSRPSAYNILTLDQAPSGLVYAAGVEMENGAYVFDAQTVALLDSLTPANTGGGLSSNNLRAVRFDVAGKGWFGSAARGLDVWDGKGTLDHADDSWVHHDVSPSNEVTSIAVLDTNAAWIGTTSGAGRLAGAVFTRVLTTLGSPGLPSGQVNDLTLDSRGNVWIATSGGLVRSDASGSGRIEVFTTADGLVDEDVQALAWDAGHGVLWVGTGKGISRVVPVFGDEPGFTDRTYVYPNPSRAAGGSLKIGGIQNAFDGEIRDVSGNLIRRFRCDPATTEIWDLKTADGSPASSGIYLVVLRDKGQTKVLRAAVIR